MAPCPAAGDTLEVIQHFGFPRSYEPRLRMPQQSITPLERSLLTHTGTFVGALLPPSLSCTTHAKSPDRVPDAKQPSGGRVQGTRAHKIAAQHICMPVGHGRQGHVRLRSSDEACVGVTNLGECSQSWRIKHAGNNTPAMTCVAASRLQGRELAGRPTQPPQADAGHGAMRAACARAGLRLLGFKPLSSLADSHQQRPAQLVYPDAGRRRGSDTAFVALLDAMLAQDAFALCSYVRSARFGGRLVALVAQQEVKDETGRQARLLQPCVCGSVHLEERIKLKKPPGCARHAAGGQGRDEAAGAPPHNRACVRGVLV